LLSAERPYVFLWAERVPVALSAKVRPTQGEIALDTPNWLDGAQH
jgi:peptide/nickel transport system substrate-binding protein